MLEDQSLKKRLLRKRWTSCTAPLTICAIPARYIVDRDAIIRYAEADPDYTVRPDPQHTIDALKSL